MLNKFIKIITNPITAIVTVIILCVCFFVYTIIYRKTDNKFLSFGPTKDENNKYVLFLGIELDTWNKLIFTYIFIFVVSIFSDYYKETISNNIYNYLNNYMIKKIKSNELIFYIVLFIDPFINTLLYIINFYTLATFQLQYIIPQFLGTYLVSLPFMYSSIRSKKFV